jgi:hypothetical protein
VEAQVVVVAPASPLGPFPYPPSWLDRVLSRLDNLPGPTWVSFALVAIVSVLVAEALLVLAGRDLARAGPRFGLLALVVPYSLVLVRHLDTVAGEATDRFRPLLGVESEAFEALRYRITVLPSSVAIPVSIAVTIATGVAALNAPSAFEITGVSWPLAVALLAFATVIGVTYSALLLQVLRQLVLVDRIHRAAKIIDLFNPAPLHAFSRLTAQASLGLLLLAAILAAGTGPQLAESSTQFAAGVGAFYATFALAGIATFVVPLYGMHQRIAAEKDRLRTAADARLRALLDAFHGDTTQLEMSRADGLNKLIGTALQEREVLAKLPTWPWQAGTFRGFTSALLLPVAVYLLARAAERVVL